MEPQRGREKGRGRPDRPTQTDLQRDRQVEGETEERDITRVITFADGPLLSHHPVLVHVGDVDGEVPAPAGHPARHRHAQRVVGLLGKCHSLLVARGLLARVLHTGNRK